MIIAICTFLIKEMAEMEEKFTEQKEISPIPMQKDRQGNYKIKRGELIRVFMTSVFFLEEADEEREKEQ